MPETDYPDTPDDEAVLPYTEQSVWSIQFVRTEPDATKPYLKALSSEWVPIMEEAKRSNLILGYRILLTPPAHRDDWNVMIMVEVENMAALDGYSERIARISRGLSGGSACVTVLDKVSRPPDFIGMKLLREVGLR